MLYEELPEGSLASENDDSPPKIPLNCNEFRKDAFDNINVTKETVTDNSGSEDSINIATELDQLITSRILMNCPGDETSIWQSMDPQVEITSSESLFPNDSHATGNGEYHPLDSSGEKQWRELSMSGLSEFSADQMSLADVDKISSSKSSRSSILAYRSMGSRSSNLKMLTLSSCDDSSLPKPRLGFKSKAFRKAQSYVAMQTVDHNSSILSTSKSTSTCNSDLPILNGKAHTPKEVRPLMDMRFAKTSKLARNASFLSIIRKKSKKERSIDNFYDVLKTTLITSTERGSDDDDTFPQGNDFDWEEFPSNTFATSKAEI